MIEVEPTATYPAARDAVCPSLLFWMYSFVTLSVLGIIGVLAGVAPLLVAAIYGIALAAIGSGCALIHNRD